jgi:hypothetical protein
VVRVGGRRKVVNYILVSSGVDTFPVPVVRVGVKSGDIVREGREVNNV